MSYGYFKPLNCYASKLEFKNFIYNVCYKIVFFFLNSIQNIAVK